jgi:hypothetical protein
VNNTTLTPGRWPVQPSPPGIWPPGVNRDSGPQHRSRAGSNGGRKRTAPAYRLPPTLTQHAPTRPRSGPSTPPSERRDIG